MADKHEVVVAFDVLLRGAAGETIPTVETIDQFRPPQKAVEFCVRWLSRHGATCHRADFSLACEMPLDEFERLFDLKLQRGESAKSRAAAAAAPSISVPTELEPYVEQITITPQPEMLG